MLVASGARFQEHDAPCSGRKPANRTFGWEAVLVVRALDFRADTEVVMDKSP